MHSTHGSLGMLLLFFWFFLSVGVGCFIIIFFGDGEGREK